MLNTMLNIVFSIVHVWLVGASAQTWALCLWDFERMRN